MEKMELLEKKFYKKGLKILLDLWQEFQKIYK